MDYPIRDVAFYILKFLNITTKRKLAQVNTFWYKIINGCSVIRKPKDRHWLCSKHQYHCKLCVSRINNGKINKYENSKHCRNLKWVNICNLCSVTFCKHLKNKKSGKHYYNKNRDICGICAKN